MSRKLVMMLFAAGAMLGADGKAVSLELRRTKMRFVPSILTLEPLMSGKSR